MPKNENVRPVTGLDNDHYTALRLEGSQMDEYKREIASQSVGQFVVTSKGAVVRVQHDSETQMLSNDRVVCGEMSASSPQFRPARADQDATTGRYTEEQRDSNIIHHEQSYRDGMNPNGIILGGSRILASGVMSAINTS